MSRLRKYLFAGLIIWLPLGVTVLVIRLLVNAMDQVLVVLPEAYHPDQLLGFHIPGLGLVLSIVVVLGTGMIAANLFGRRLVSAWEALLSRIPLVRTVYTGVKQVAETVFSERGSSFRKVLLVEYPRAGMWTIAFHTGSYVGEVQRRTRREVVNIFVPTTPNPTSGFFLMVPREEVIELDMSVDEGIRMIMSMGMIVPDARASKPEVASDE